MNSSITVRNPERTEFNFEKINLVSNYNIILHCVYDLVNHFEELDFLATCTEKDLVILWHPVEMGVWESAWMNQLSQIVADAKFKLIYLTGCSNQLNINKFLPYSFDLRFFPVFDVRSQDLFDRKKAWARPVMVDKNNKFLFLNSKDIPHRRHILGALIKNNLLNQCIISYRCSEGLLDIETNFNLVTGFTEEQLVLANEYARLAFTKLPITIDNHTVSAKLPRSMYLDSYLNIVGETSFINVPHSFNMSFVTEKTYNAIANNQMFIIVGHAGSLSLLKSLGYKTFGGIIDESYDTIKNNGQRLEAVTNEIIRFISRPIEEIKYDYNQVVDIIEHNRDLLYSQNLQTRLQNLIDEYK